MDATYELLLLKFFYKKIKNARLQTINVTFHLTVFKHIRTINSDYQHLQNPAVVQ